MYDNKRLSQKLKELQSLPLDRKILITQTRIIEWYQHYNGNVCVNFSGGKDSTVLLDIARRIYPEIQAVFINTGLEYPEIRRFALSKENVIEVRPRWGNDGKRCGKEPDGIVSFFDTVTVYGYPIISKMVSNAISEARKPNGKGGNRWRRLHGEITRMDGKQSNFDYSRYLPIFHLPFRISDVCCDVMKKNPARTFQKETGNKPIIATMADESIRRTNAWITRGGCNAFDGKEPSSNPMSFWTEQDVLQYIVRYGIEICSVYGDIVAVDEDGISYDHSATFFNEAPLACTGCRRTGCIFCAFGAHLEKGEGRFQRLKKTHSRQYEFCMDGGDWKKNDFYDPSITDKELWNPEYLWMPNKKGLGMSKVFDLVNEIYGKNFIPY